MLWLPLLGTPPHPYLQFEVGASLPGSMAGAPAWLAVNLLAILLATWLAWARRLAIVRTTVAD